MKRLTKLQIESEAGSLAFTCTARFGGYSAGRVLRRAWQMVREQNKKLKEKKR